MLGIPKEITVQTRTLRTLDTSQLPWAAVNQFGMVFGVFQWRDRAAEYKQSYGSTAWSVINLETGQVIK